MVAKSNTKTTFVRREQIINTNVGTPMNTKLKPADCQFCTLRLRLNIPKLLWNPGFAGFSGW